MTGLESIDVPIILLLGGQDKNLNFKKLEKIINQKCRVVIVFGTSREKILQEMQLKTREQTKVKLRELEAMHDDIQQVKVLYLKVFDEIYLLTQGGPGTATEVISFSIYETFFDSDNMGLGSVMSVVSLFVISLLIIVVLNIIRRANKYAN